MPCMGTSEKILRNATAVCACSALAAVCFFAIECGLLVRESRAELLILAQDSQRSLEHLSSTTLPAADRAIAQMNQDAITANAVLKQTQTVQANLNQRITDTSQNLNAILIQTGLAADQVREASIQQKTYWNHISRDTDTLLKSLNSGAHGLDSNMTDLHALLADQNWHHALSQADGILTDTHSMTTDTKAAVHRYTQPPTKKEKFLEGAKDVGGLTYLIFKIVQILP